VYSAKALEESGYVSKSKQVCVNTLLKCMWCRQSAGSELPNKYIHFEERL